MCRDSAGVMSFQGSKIANTKRIVFGGAIGFCLALAFSFLGNLSLHNEPSFIDLTVAAKLGSFATYTPVYACLAAVFGGWIVFKGLSSLRLTPPPYTS